MALPQVSVRLALIFGAFGILPLSAFASISITGANGLAVSVDPSGSYNLSAANGWHFSGNIGKPLGNVAATAGIDANGHFSQIDFDFQTDAPRHAFIRAWWDQAAVLFSTTVNTAAANSFSFPVFTTYPRGLNHIAFSGVFANPTFTVLPNESPWAFFDSHGDTFVLSPAANFMVADLSQPSALSISSSIDSQIAAVPQGFTHQTLLVTGQGIGATFGVWGQTLTNLQGKTRPTNDADTSLAQLGYWTDNGGTYYYHTEGSKSYQDTLLDVEAAFNAAHIQLGYLQLDSWFYPKGPAADWSNGAYGFSQYEAAPALFGSGLSSFQQQLGVPLVTHARWIDASSPYRQQYQVSGNVATDPAYWDYAANYLQANGVATYEQDWLVGPAIPNFNLTDPEAFLGNMAASMAKRGLTMQYCMPSPRHVLQSSKYSNLTTIRGAADRFTPDRWTAFLYASTLIGSVGAWPFSDVFMSSETSNMLLATLSAGPVGIGDPINGLNVSNLTRSVRADGVIVKPDTPAAPIDLSFQNSAAAVDSPIVAAASTRFGNLAARYVFAYATGQNTTVSLRLSDLGMTGEAYIYDYFAGSGHVVTSRNLIGAPITGDSLYLVVVPVGQSGIAVIGDTGHFVTWGKKRVTSLTDDGNVHLSLAFAPGETSRQIEGYSPTDVRAAATDGSVTRVTYDAAARRFSIVVTPGADGAATVQIDRLATALVRPAGAR